MKIEGQRAVVTGGGAGIGRAISLALASRGCDVVVADVDEQAASAVAKEAAGKGVRAVAAACDVTSLESVEALAERAWSELGGVDLLFNNAGVGGGTMLLDSDVRDLHWIFEVNVAGVWHGCCVFGKRFREQPTQAWIVNTGSEHSLGFAHLGMGFYTASKHAVLGLSDVLRHELPENIGVSVLCPGMVRTEIWNAGRNRPERFGGKEAGNTIAEKILAQGMDPEEIAKRTLDGVEAEEFLIVTHSHARRYAQERWESISSAFDRQAPYREEDERYDVTKVLQQMLGET